MRWEEARGMAMRGGGWWSRAGWPDRMRRIQYRAGHGTTRAVAVGSSSWWPEPRVVWHEDFGPGEFAGEDWREWPEAEPYVVAAGGGANVYAGPPVIGVVTPDIRIYIEAIGVVLPLPLAVGKIEPGTLYTGNNLPVVVTLPAGARVTSVLAHFEGSTGGAANVDAEGWLDIGSPLLGVVWVAAGGDGLAGLGSTDSLLGFPGTAYTGPGLNSTRAWWDSGAFDTARLDGSRLTLRARVTQARTDELRLVLAAERW